MPFSATSANFAAWSRPIEGCIRDGQKAGEISRDLDPRVLAGFLLSSFEGAMLRMKAEKDGLRTRSPPRPSFRLLPQVCRTGWPPRRGNAGLEPRKRHFGGGKILNPETNELAHRNLAGAGAPGFIVG